MKNESLFEQARRVIPGGVNSPVRAFGSVGGSPVFIDRASGPYLYSAEGVRYIDYVGSWGPMILGHADPGVVRAIQRQAEYGLSFGAPTELETRLARLVCDLLPWVEQLRMVNSGTEATMSAIRLARGFTGRDKIIKFEGCYHGHADGLLVKAGSGALTFGVPTSPGVPAAFAAQTLTARYNDLESVAGIFSAIGDQVAAVILEPVAGNMNCVPPTEGFLQGVRDLCDEHGALLIMDEVMTGFRVGLRGAQGLYGVTGDLTALGKVIGGGLPVGAFGGRADIMAHLAPQGRVYQAGTLSGNPIAMTAGLATLERVAESGFYEAVAAATERLVEGLFEAASDAGVALQANRVGAMFGIFFTDLESIGSLDDVMQCDQGKFSVFFHGMLGQGVHFAPSAFEAGFVSAAHDPGVIGETLEAARKVLGEMTP